MIKSIIVKLYSSLINLNRCCLWYIDYLNFRFFCTPKKRKRVDKFQRALILIPHADDEWVGCSCIINNVSDVLLVNVDMQGGDSGDLHKERLHELNKVADQFNKTLTTLPFPKEESLRAIVDRFRPTHIYVPFFFDWHQEHIQTMFLLKDALRSLTFNTTVAMYQVSLPIIPEMVTHYIPMNKDTFVNKWKFFECIYKTQLGIPYKRFSINEKINGAYVGSYAVEVFSYMTKDEWLRMIDDWTLTNEEMALIKTNLQRIRKTRVLLKSFYNKRMEL